MSAAPYDTQEIRRCLTLLAPDGVFEVRAPKARMTGYRSATAAGYFNTHDDTAIAMIGSLSGKAPGVYLTLNSVNPALLARAANRLNASAEQTTSDADILSRRWLLLDLDPVRPAGISASDAEREAAYALANTVRAWLTAQGWPDPILADSGNGTHLLYKVSLPNDATSKTLVESVLKALAARFDTDQVKVDTTVANAARISKVYGTLAAKGDSTEDRPHRIARLLDIPDPLSGVSVDQLALLAAQAPIAPAPVPAFRSPLGTVSHGSRPASGNFYDQVKDCAMRSLSSWVPTLFPDATPHQDGYRVTSKALNRDQEESLSILQRGIKDFGLHDQGDPKSGKRTAIDLVMDYGPYQDAASAALWLCQQMGIAPESLGWKQRLERTKVRPNAPKVRRNYSPPAEKLSGNVHNVHNVHTLVKKSPDDADRGAETTDSEVVAEATAGETADIDGREDFDPAIAGALARCKDDPGILMSPEFIQAWRLIRQTDPEEDLRIRVAIKRIKPSGVLLSDLDKAIRVGETGSTQDERTIADQLVALVLDEADLFHDAEKNAFATLGERIKQTYRLDTQAFSDWLGYAYYSQTAQENEGGIGCAASETALKTALVTLSGIAKHHPKSGEHPCYLRVAPWSVGYLLDLGDESWRAIEVLPTGWRIIESPPVRFWRPNPARPLPTPVANSDLTRLWDFLNIPPDDRLLVLAWMLEAFRPDTPFTLLELCGSQGSAKSFTQDKLRRLIDPNAVNLRAAPKTTEDLFVGAGCNWLVSMNNLSHLSAPQQDALCTLATGGGFAGRTLYTNADETLIECKRPVVINGIVPVVTAQDLTDRVIHVEMPDITEYREESALITEFETQAPALFGGLLDLFVATLARLSHVKLSHPPRMADFARLGEAMAQALGEPEGRFVELFAANRRQSTARSLDASPVGSAIREMADAKLDPIIFDGTMKRLLDDLEGYRPSGEAWPKTPRGLGDALRRQRPALKTLGITVEIGPAGRAGVPVRVVRYERYERYERRFKGFTAQEKPFASSSNTRVYE